jgi:hypothetical protein
MTAPRYVLEDPSLPHQIVIRRRPNGYIGVSCNCMAIGVLKAGAEVSYRPIAAKAVWGSGDAYACWLEHMAEIGEAVA